jgi:Zn-dependent M28 family amino/carboxypeptidase
VELWFAAFGSEEVGQRGSTFFVQQHKAELLAKDAYFVNLECTGGGNILLLATAETMCVPPVKHHPEVYNLLKDASRRVMIRRQTIRSELTQGYTDAEPFSRYGLKACSIVGLMMDGFPMLWHINSDVPDNLHPGCMRDVMEIAIKAVEMRQANLDGDICSTGSDSEIPCADSEL